VTSFGLGWGGTEVLELGAASPRKLPRRKRGRCFGQKHVALPISDEVQLMCAGRDALQRRRAFRFPTPQGSSLSASAIAIGEADNTK
jgi:hypothetical protein